MTTRAKFRCNGIDLRQGQAINPKVRAEVPGVAYSPQEMREKAEEMGEELYVSVDLPTVHLSPVTGGPDATAEDRAFWEASPQGEIKLTITNPDAVETFELGKSYYVDFSPAAD